MRLESILEGIGRTDHVRVRRLYAAAGLGWLLAPTAWPGLRRLADWAYALFARNRLALTGRSGCTAGSCSRAG